MFKQSLIVGLLLLALVAIPLSSPAQTPAVTNGLNWLSSTQTGDGGWPGVVTEEFVATATATETLFLLSSAAPGYGQGVQWLEGRPVSQTDLLTRRIVTLARAGHSTTAEVTQLLALRDAGGGWGGDDGYLFNTLDTALALQALKAANYGDSGIIFSSLTCLTNAQKSDGGFGFSKNDPTSTYLTAVVVNTLALFNATYPVQGALDQGIAFLLTRQNPDHGFGSSPSTVSETALAIAAIASAGELNVPGIQAGLGALQYLGASQQQDGSWQSDPFATALALKALALTLPDLTLQADDLHASTNAPLAGDSLTVTATVRNLGLETAANVTVQLRDNGVLLGEQIVAALAPGAATEVPFAVAALAPAGEHTLEVLLDPQGSLAELREENNRRVLRLWVAERPDLVATGDYLLLTPEHPRAGGTVTMSAWIANLGETAVARADAELWDGDPANGGVQLGSFSFVDLAPGAWSQASYAFSTPAAGVHTLYLRLDPDNAVPEGDETNNLASRTVTVAAAVAGSIDLFIPADGLRLNPARPRSGEAVTITLQALHLGTESASAELELFDGDPLVDGVALYRQTLAFNPGETKTINIPWSASGGTHTLCAFLDRSDQVAEIDETNNRATVAMMFDMVDIALSASDLSITPSQPMAGDAASVAVTVRNVGIEPTGSFSVDLYNGDPAASGALLQRFTVAGLDGDGATQLVYPLTAERGTYRFYVVADSNGTVSEFDEGNNLAIRSLSVKTSAEAQGPDLVPFEIDLTATTQDTQTLRIAGTALVKIQNQGDDKVAASYQVTIFEDRNADGHYTAGQDNTLGTATYAQSMWPNGVALAMVPLAGSLSFRDAPLYALVDSGDAIPEQREENNLIRHGSDCEKRPAKLIEPVVKWKWGENKNSYYKTSMVESPPLIINLTDDNGDGLVNDHDVPEVVFAAEQRHFASNGAEMQTGRLTALSGDTGQKLFSVFDADHPINVDARFAAGDIDGDGLPEIVTPRYNSTGLIAYEHDGTRKWDNQVQAEQWRINNKDKPTATYTNSIPALADLDGDNQPEIITGPTVTNADGSVRWTGIFGTTSWVVGTGSLSIRKYNSIVADLDLDGMPEVLAGNTVYNRDGSVKWWNKSLYDGTTAVGNLDDDPYPEIVLFTMLPAPGGGATPNLYVLEHDGSIKWGPLNLWVLEGGGGQSMGSPPVIADFDGDGQPEIGVKGFLTFFILSKEGAVKTRINLPYRANGTNQSPAVFDLNGDGRKEIIFNVEDYFRIFDGKDGTLLYEEKFGSGFGGYQNTVVADIDNDQHAEIVSVGYGWEGSMDGIRVYRAKNNDWVDARSIWNQTSYHVTNVNDDGTLPQYEAPSWLLNNSYRENVPVALPTASPYRAADLTASYVRVAMTGYPGEVTITARIGNGGAKAAASGVAVAIYDGDPAAGGVLIGTTATTVALQPGTYEDVALLWNAPAEGQHTLTVQADHDGSCGRVEECDDANNRAALSVTLHAGVIVAGNLPDLALTSGDIVLNAGTTEGSLTTVAVTVRNLGTVAAENVPVRFYLGHPARGGVAIGSDQVLAQLAAGAAATLTFPWNTLGRLGVNYLYAVADPGDHLTETNEGNNLSLALAEILPGQQPDVQIGAGDLSVSTSTPREGEALTVFATLHNRGATVGNIKLALYDGDPAAGANRLGAATVAPFLAMGESATVSFPLDTIGWIGSHDLRVVLDPENAIVETDEGNNRAAVAVSVVTAGVTLAVTTDQPAYGENEAVQIALSALELGNSGRALVFDLRIEEPSGLLVATVSANGALQLAAGGQVTMPLQWNTATLPSGAYRLIALLREGDRTVARATSPLEILPNKGLSLALTTDKAAYTIDETAEIAVALTPSGANYIFSALNAKMEIVDAQGGAVFTEERATPLLTPRQTTQLKFFWKTTGSKGAYTARVTLRAGEEQLGTAARTLDVLGSSVTLAGVSGTLSVEPATIEHGDIGALVCTVRNQGNESVAGSATVMIVDPESGQAVRTIVVPEPLALAVGGAQTIQLELATAGFGVKNYLALLRFEAGATQKSLAATPFQVQDETPPTLAVLSPVMGETYRTAFSISAQAHDSASGIAKVEYRLDGVEVWTPLALTDPSREEYTILWEPTLATEIDHSLMVRAADNNGNVTLSAPVLFTIRLDATPPVTTLNIGEPHYGTSGETHFVAPETTITLSAVDDLSGVQTTSYRFDDAPDEQHYSGPLRLTDLAYGPHTLRYRSVDFAGNAEEEKRVILSLLGVEVATELLNRPRVLVWTEDPAHGGKAPPDYSLAELRALLGEALGDPEIYATVITDKEEFRDLLRSGIYNIVMVIRQDIPLDMIFLREMREAVNRGTGLLVSHWGNSVPPLWQELFGVDFKGALSMAAAERTLHLYAGPLGDEQTLTVSGRVLKTTLTDGTLAGIIPAESVCAGVRSLTLHAAVRVQPGDRVQARLSTLQGKKLVLVDEEELVVAVLPTAAVNRFTGHSAGDLALLHVADDGVTLSLGAADGYLEVSYSLVLNITHPDGSSIATGPVDLTPTCSADLQAGMEVGPFRVVAVDEVRVKTGADLPAVILGRYGAGKTALLTYDLITSDLAGERSTHLALLGKAASYLLSAAALPEAGGVSLLETRLRQHGSGFTLRAVESLGAGLTHVPLFDLQQSPLSCSFHLADGEEAVWRHFVRFADRQGDFTKTTAISLGLESGEIPYADYPAHFNVAADAHMRLLQALTWVEEQLSLHPEEAAALRTINDDLIRIDSLPRTTSAETDLLIHDIVQTLHQALQLGIDVTGLRRLLDDYLRIVSAEEGITP
jgi:large repetitive protein